jgi:hypothetical protein
MAKHKLPQREHADNLTIRLPESMRAGLERIAAREDLTVSQLIRHLLAAHLRADGELATSNT